MSWKDRLRKPHLPKKQLLFFSQEQLHNDYFAVIRATWFKDGKVCGVTESQIHNYDVNAIAEFTDIISTALHAGADVSALCIAPAEELGIEPT